MNATYALAATIVFTAILWMPYTLERMRVLGVGPVLGNPSADEPPLAPWAARAAAAHRNAVENLVLFGPAVGLAMATGTAESSLVAGAAWVYLVARIAHVLVYVAGIPVLRTLTFAAGWAATLAIVVGAFQ